MTRALCAKFKSVRIPQKTGSEARLLMLGGACTVQAHMKKIWGNVHVCALAATFVGPRINHTSVLLAHVCIHTSISWNRMATAFSPQATVGTGPCPQHPDRIVGGMAKQGHGRPGLNKTSLGTPALICGDSSGLRRMQRARTVVPMAWNEK